MEKPTPTKLAASTGISIPYASQILTGKRQPPRNLAIHIYRITGWKHASIGHLSSKEMDMLDRLEKWVTRGDA